MENKTPEEAFNGVKPDISHLRIFGCPIYIHVPKEKRLKLEASGRKGIFVGYSETSKAYRIYIPGQRQIELSRDVIFEEGIAFKKARRSDEVETPDSHKRMEEDISLEFQREYTDETTNESQIPPETQEEEPENNHKRPLWARKMIQEAEILAAPKGTFRESKRPRKLTS